MVPNLA